MLSFVKDKQTDRRWLWLTELNADGGQEPARWKRTKNLKIHDNTEQEPRARWEQSICLNSLKLVFAFIIKDQISLFCFGNYVIRMSKRLGRHVNNGFHLIGALGTHRMECRLPFFVLWALLTSSCGNFPENVSKVTFLTTTGNRLAVGSVHGERKRQKRSLNTDTARNGFNRP